MKKLLSLVLALLLALSFAGCSGSTAMTEKNVTATVDQAFSALKDFNTKKLEKYVDSKTLSVIITYANKHDQFADLGKALFKNLEYNIESIDLDAKTVTVSVRNKDLKDTASAFTKALVSKYSALQMLGLLNNETWLNTSLKSLTDSIAIAKMQSAPVSVTLTVTAGKKNLMLGFDDAAENAVSGGALPSGQVPDLRTHQQQEHHREHKATDPWRRNYYIKIIFLVTILPNCGTMIVNACKNQAPFQNHFWKIHQ